MKDRRQTIAKLASGSKRYPMMSPAFSEVAYHHPHHQTKPLPSLQLPQLKPHSRRCRRSIGESQAPKAGVIQNHPSWHKSGWLHPNKKKIGPPSAQMSSWLTVYCSLEIAKYDVCHHVYFYLMHVSLDRLAGQLIEVTLFSYVQFNMSP